jgi:hypothetical protein
VAEAAVAIADFRRQRPWQRWDRIIDEDDDVVMLLRRVRGPASSTDNAVANDVPFQPSHSRERQQQQQQQQQQSTWLRSLLAYDAAGATATGRISLRTRPWCDRADPRRARRTVEREKVLAAAALLVGSVIGLGLAVTTNPRRLTLPPV